MMSAKGELAMFNVKKKIDYYGINMFMPSGNIIDYNPSSDLRRELWANPEGSIPTFDVRH